MLLENSEWTLPRSDIYVLHTYLCMKLFRRFLRKVFTDCYRQWHSDLGENSPELSLAFVMQMRIITLRNSVIETETEICSERVTRDMCICAQLFYSRLISVEITKNSPIHGRFCRLTMNTKWKVGSRGIILFLQYELFYSEESQWFIESCAMIHFYAHSNCN